MTYSSVGSLMKASGAGGGGVQDTVAVKVKS